MQRGDRSHGYFGVAVGRLARHRAAGMARGATPSRYGGRPVRPPLAASDRLGVLTMPLPRRGEWAGVGELRPAGTAAAPFDHPCGVRKAGHSDNAPISRREWAGVGELRSPTPVHSPPPVDTFAGW